MFRSFLQTQAWLDFQSRAGHKTWRFQDRGIQANVIRHEVKLSRNYLYIPHGPEIATEQMQAGIRNDVGYFISYLKQLARQEKSIFIKLEPLSDAVVELLYASGAKLKKSSQIIQPHKTLVLDLMLPELEFLGQMHHKTRYNIGLAEKKELAFRESKDAGEFWRMLQKTVKHDRFSSHPREYYEKMLELSGEPPHSSMSGGGELQTTLFMIDFQGKRVSAMLSLTYGDWAYYLHGAMDRDYRSTMAPYLLHWRAIQHFKERGFLRYDFWGIDANRWPGVTRFKLGLGGKVTEYPGAFDLVVSRFWYLMYSATKKIL